MNRKTFLSANAPNARCANADHMASRRDLYRQFIDQGLAPYGESAEEVFARGIIKRTLNPVTGVFDETVIFDPTTLPTTYGNGITFIGGTLGLGVITPTAIGVGTNSPESSVHVKFSRQQQPRGITIDNQINDVYAGSILLRHERGAGGALLRGDFLGAVCFSGNLGGAFDEHQAIFQAVAEEDFGIDHQGTGFLISTIAKNTGYTIISRVRVSSAGNLIIGSNAMDYSYAGTHGIEIEGGAQFVGQMTVINTTNLAGITVTNTGSNSPGIRLNTDISASGTRNWGLTISKNTYGDLVFIQSDSTGADPLLGTVRMSLSATAAIICGLTFNAGSATLTFGNVFATGASHTVDELITALQTAGIFKQS